MEEYMWKSEAGSGNTNSHPVTKGLAPYNKLIPTTHYTNPTTMGFYFQMAIY
jgi:hypothetical protein